MKKLPKDPLPIAVVKNSQLLNAVPNLQRLWPAATIRIYVCGGGSKSRLYYKTLLKNVILVHVIFTRTDI